MKIDAKLWPNPLSPVPGRQVEGRERQEENGGRKKYEKTFRRYFYPFTLLCSAVSSSQGIKYIPGKHTSL